MAKVKTFIVYLAPYKANPTYAVYFKFVEARTQKEAIAKAKEGYMPDGGEGYHPHKALEFRRRNHADTMYVFEGKVARL